MAVYNNQHLYENVAALRHLGMAQQDVRELWASVWAQVADNYARGVCTEVPGFAYFGRDVRGRPQAALQPAFLKASAARFSTDQKLSGALSYRALDYGLLRGTRSQLAHVLLELQSRLLYHVSKMRLNLGQLAVFSFDKRLRQYTFTFGRECAAAGRPAPEPVPAARGPPRRAQSAAPSTHAGAGGPCSRAPGPWAAAPAQQRAPRSQSAAPRPASATAPPATPLTARYQRSTRPYGGPPEAQPQPHRPAARPQSAPQRQCGWLCRGCAYDDAVARRELERRRAREEERALYAEAALRDGRLHEERERADRERYYASQAAARAYNQGVAEERRARERAFRLAGHHSRPGELQDNAAVLQDDPGLAARIRERNVRCMREQVAQAAAAAERRRDQDGALADYAERRRLEAAHRDEQRREREFRRTQQRMLRDELDYYARQPRLVRPVVTAPMSCEGLVGGLYDGGRGLESRFRADHDRCQAANQRAAEAARALRTAARGRERWDERARSTGALAALERERRERLAASVRQQRELQRAYEQQIRERADRERRAREEARWHAATHRFGDELIPVRECGRCGRAHRYDNVFCVRE